MSYVNTLWNSEKEDVWFSALNKYWSGRYVKPSHLAVEKEFYPLDTNAVKMMNPDQLKIKDAFILIKIMKNKAKELNNKFNTSSWTPRGIDMILWVCSR